MMKVEITKESLTLARHDGKVVHASVGEDDKTIQAAIDYIEWYQSKWYRKLKNCILSLFRLFKSHDINLSGGKYEIGNTIRLGNNMNLVGEE